MHGKRLDVGSKVRIPSHDSDTLGVEIPAYTATIIEMLVDAKGTILRVRENRSDHDRSVRPRHVKRMRFKAAA
jgi:hypothetical protein